MCQAFFVYALPSFVDLLGTLLRVFVLFFALVRLLHACTRHVVIAFLLFLMDKVFKLLQFSLLL